MKIKSAIYFTVAMLLCAFSLSAKSSHQTISTSDFAYQYTTDGYMQQVAIYPDSVICTNLEGPREGAQFIIMNNGALVGMCEKYSFHKDHAVHKYTWCEVKTYKNYQKIIVK